MTHNMKYSYSSHVLIVLETVLNTRTELFSMCIVHLHTKVYMSNSSDFLYLSKS
jgi:hypothetical protein